MVVLKVQASCCFNFFSLLFITLFRIEMARTQDSLRSSLSCQGLCLYPHLAEVSPRRTVLGKRVKRQSVELRSICRRMQPSTSTLVPVLVPGRLLKLCLTSSLWLIILQSLPCLSALKGKSKVGTTVLSS